jgi:hypothetical protein
VIAILKRVQDAARNVRDRLSLDSWRVINRLESFADNPAGDPLELLDDTLFTLSAFSGLAMESMTRGLGWRFMDMGRRVERAMNQTELIRIGLPQVCQRIPQRLEALLEVADSIMTYRARYRTAFQLAPVLDLLIVDESNPKSLAFPVQPAGGPRRAPAPQSDRTLRQSGRAQWPWRCSRAVRLLDLTGLRCTPERRQTTALMEAFSVSRRPPQGFCAADQRPLFDPGPDDTAFLHAPR